MKTTKETLTTALEVVKQMSPEAVADLVKLAGSREAAIAVLAVLVSRR